MVAEMQPCNNSFLCLHTHYASLYIHLSLNVNPRASSLWFLSKSLALLASWIVTAIPSTSPEKQWHPEQNCKEYPCSILQPWQPLLPTCQKGSKINYMLGVITPSLAIYVLHQKARTIFHSSPLIMSNSIVTAIPCWYIVFLELDIPQREICMNGCIRPWSQQPIGYYYQER